MSERVKERILDERLIVCHQCGYETNESASTTCFICGANLTEETKEKKVEISLRKKSRIIKNLIITTALTAIAGLSFYTWARPINGQAKPIISLPRQGVLAYWGAPCQVRLMSEKIGQQVGIEGSKITLRLTDVYRDRRAIDELIDAQLSLILDEQNFLPQHFEKANKRGVALDGLQYALDGVAYITNEDLDGADSLSLEQLEKIYRGEIINWKEVGGTDVKIEPILLSELGIKSLFLDFQGKLNPHTIYVKNRKQAIAALKRNPGALFYTSASLAALEKNVKIISLSNDNGQIVSPVVEGKSNVEAFRNGIYPQVRSLYAIYRKDEQSPSYEMVKSFRDFLISPKGQSIVEKAGFVPVYATLEDSKASGKKTAFLPISWPK